MRQIGAFRDLSNAALTLVLEAGQELSFVAGAKLLVQGEDSAFAIIMLEGEVSIVSERAGGAFPVATIRAPALIGEIGALADLPRTASAVALTEVSALRIARPALLEALNSAPDALGAVIRQLGQQIKGLNAALGLYADGLHALERGELDDELAHDLGRTTPELQNFSEAFARLSARIQQERRSRADMASAALIQREMLPRALDAPSILARCDVFGDMIAAKDVGGDLYDILPLDEDRLAICVGDVCGKGVPASLFMCLCVATLRMAAREAAPIGEMMARVNSLLFAQNPTSMFATLFFGVLNSRNGQFDYVNCGHNAPYLLRADGSSARLPTGGPPIGIVHDKSWPVTTLHLGEGDALFLFTDGVSEAFDRHGAEYGEERVLDVLKTRDGRDAAAMVRAVEDDVARFAEGVEQADDITCLALIMR